MTPVSITTTEREYIPTQKRSSNLEAILEPVHRAKTILYTIATVDDITAKDEIDDCAIPQFGGSPHFESPEFPGLG